MRASGRPVKGPWPPPKPGEAPVRGEVFGTAPLPLGTAPGMPPLREVTPEVLPPEAPDRGSLTVRTGPAVPGMMPGTGGLLPGGPPIGPLLPGTYPGPDPDPPFPEAWGVHGVSAVPYGAVRELFP
ncbi:hypothetical protein B4N89_21410 [Embleya scabrispora]|uniref:Uncharacterized protein n=1 Tax=Embleya scabrispora TaxID=159449 RepID=A0A1T3P2C9_9ACTN|nr:hypothetical protein B4N89_21410 [Embleya scabrispora]